MFSLGELANQLQLTLRGDADIPISGLASLASAGPGELSFIVSNKYLSELSQTSAAAVIIPGDLQDSCNLPCLVSDDPYLSYARASALFETRSSPAEGVHPSAVVHVSAVLGDGVCVGPHAFIDADVRLGDDCVIEAGVVIGANSVLGAGTRICANTTVYHGVSMGSNCLVQSNSAIGSDGFGYAPTGSGWQKIHQLGGVRIGDRVEIGSGCAIDRGALEDTVIEDGVIIDNQVHIAHNCRIGKNTAIAGCVGIAGSTTIGANCTMGGQVGIAGHLTIADNVHLGGQARVTRSIEEPGAYTSGTLLAPLREWTRNASRVAHVDKLFKRVAELEKKTNNGGS